MYDEIIGKCERRQVAQSDWKRKPYLIRRQIGQTGLMLGSKQSYQSIWFIFRALIAIVEFLKDFNYKR